ncbi:hypothetical protein PM076_01040 [Halorubrum ezzemoulense]|uniref:DUF1102 domain-containing protein n=1 Tax=Halorubrum ezzemoulense TaxID=337243 RepID=A0ABT4Z7L6_HALEZ|nr:hypothetical protein [Halorubrum ezzemoulense]MDB2244986.1 hypothetical protein [Halorubrum ezzemoulense]MDB2251193.1 hypothetical protein [Halorubrum ezzemoulense]MDB2278257.1 hypothetical protein [Halorubrum ezzemoulense]MDB2284931.1 hypothetical protein [Halorubrum ezzemoulense]MDB2288321.1 hypothetical protein [Halorubrum ezzemoulense]
MERRKFVIGLGSLAAGGAAATGTGAFTTAEASRTVTVETANDRNAEIAMIPGDGSDITLNEEGEIELDLTQHGVNVNSTYSWGDPEDPSSDPAFSFQNNDSQNYDFFLEFIGSNTGWVTAGKEQSKIIFTVSGDRVNGSMTYPPQYQGASNESSLPDVQIDETSGEQFRSSDTVDVAVTVDTTGADASTEDDLSGSLRLETET